MISISNDWIIIIIIIIIIKYYELLCFYFVFVFRFFSFTRAHFVTGLWTVKFVGK
jgi:hypothetical protein